jgi:hypothetical protein
MSGTAQQLSGPEAERKAIRRPSKPSHDHKEHPKDTLAAGSCWRLGQVQEQTTNIWPRPRLRGALRKYPKSERFEEAVEACFASAKRI